MKFTSENPSKRYKSVLFNCAEILVDESDFNPLTVGNAIDFCQTHGYTFNGIGITAVFYLRGRLSKVDYSDVLVGILEAEVLPEKLFEIVHCLSFWNQTGVENYNRNKEGDESYRDFILRCIACDCRVFVKPCQDKFITGQGGNHVWVSDKSTNQRILIIHF